MAFYRVCEWFNIDAEWWLAFLALELRYEEVNDFADSWRSRDLDRSLLC